MVVPDSNKWVPVASALSAFWKDGDGPSASNVHYALGFAGIDYESVQGSNKADMVLKAVKHGDPAQKRRVVTELVDLLVQDDRFQQESSRYRPTEIGRLRDVLHDVGGSLAADGSLDWPEEGGNNKAPSVAQPGHAGITGPLQPAAGLGTPPAEESWGPSIATLLKLLEALPKAARPLTGKRRSGQEPVRVWDEYDVQDFIEMALRMLYDDVRPEETQESIGGLSPRVDFSIKNAHVIVEAKVAHIKHSRASIVRELTQDILMYSKRENVRDLVLVVYDLDGSLNNPAGFKADLEEYRAGDLRVHVVAAPWTFSSRPSAAASNSKADSAPIS